jgi:hypothetical protein
MIYFHLPVEYVRALHDQAPGFSRFHLDGGRIGEQWSLRDRRMTLLIINIRLFVSTILDAGWVLRMDICTLP